MKDVQRPVGAEDDRRSLPTGARLLEIGAGEPSSPTCWHGSATT